MIHSVFLTFFLSILAGRGQSRPRCGTPLGPRNRGSAWVSFVSFSWGIPPCKRKRPTDPLENERLWGLPRTLFLGASRPKSSESACAIVVWGASRACNRNRFPVRRTGDGGGVPSSAPESPNASLCCPYRVAQPFPPVNCFSNLCSIAQIAFWHTEPSFFHHHFAQRLVRFLSVRHGDVDMGQSPDYFRWMF